jgi:DivIVA domain-containing protein
VPIDRQTIEKRDFPIGRRGYDPEAVDAHLAAIAEDVEQLKSTSRRRTETLASAASEQVRAIVEAAESSAAEIQRQAEEEAADIRAEASEEAQTTRQQATSQAREYVGKVSESTAVMLQRLDAMESELSALLESLRTGANRLGADLQLLEGNLDDVKGSVAPRPRFEPEYDTPEPPVARSAAPARPARATPAAEPAPPAFEPEPEPEPEYEPPVVPPAPDDPIRFEPDAERPTFEPDPTLDGPIDPADDETEGARLVALNMALNGTPREETDRYLAENYLLSDRAGLLDEVYASIAD